MRHLPWKRSAVADERGSVPLELLVVFPLLGLIAGFLAAWDTWERSAESSYSAENIAEIRASNSPDVADLLEEEYVTEMRSRFGGCEVSEKPETDPADVGVIPVAVTVSCESAIVDALTQRTAVQQGIAVASAGSKCQQSAAVC